MIDFSRCPWPPMPHQAEDSERLVGMPFALDASEMRTGKTKKVIDAMIALYEADAIDKVIVVAPAPVRDVWFDPEIGELAKHMWRGLPVAVMEFHAKLNAWSRHLGEPGTRRLEIFVTNYEFIKSQARIVQLQPACGPRTLLIGDESAFLKGHKSARTKQFLGLRRLCGRCWLLNGTPIYHSPMDLYSQGNILSPTILDCPHMSQFMARYATMESVRGAGGKALTDKWGNPIKRVKSWVNLDDIKQRFAPYTIRRLQKDCLGREHFAVPKPFTCRLEPSTWDAYKMMRDELVIWLKDNQVASASSAALKVMRLAQVTSGFISGVEAEHPLPVLDVDFDLGLFTDDVVVSEVEPEVEAKDLEATQEIGREKLDVLAYTLERAFEANENAKVVVWSRFRFEVERATAMVKEKFPSVDVANVWGGQKRAERLRALSLLKPETAPSGPVVVIGIEGTGSFGLDMSAASHCIQMSTGYTAGRVAQTLDRTYHHEQRHDVAYSVILATGPQGQKTIDHVIERAWHAGHDVATWTASAWVSALKNLDSPASQEAVGTIGAG